MRSLKWLIAGLGLFSATSMADVVNLDWQTEGDSALVYDDETEKTWLALTETAGMTLSEVKAEMNEGSLQGWRFASRTEFLALLQNIFIEPVVHETLDYVEMDTQISQHFITLFGDMSESVFDVPNATNMSMGMIVKGEQWYVGGRYRDDMPRLYNGSGERAWKGADRKSVV